jgi:hypothetical protein
VPYATQQELDLAAQRLGKLLIGRNQGQQIGFALDDYWLSDPPPLQTIAVTEPDGSNRNICWTRSRSRWMRGLPLGSKRHLARQLENQRHEFHW